MSTILFIDIETVSAVAHYEDLVPERQHLRNNKVKHLTHEDKSPSQQYADKAGIYAEFGKIICISVGRIIDHNGTKQIKLKSRTGHDESQLLSCWIEDLKPYLYDNETKLCGHNGKEFDFPRLTRRLLIHGIPLPTILNTQGKKPREIGHIDTMEMRKCGDYKSYTSLNLLAHLFGLPTPKDDIDGSQISAVYRQQQDLERIAHYCEKDVITTANLYRKMTGQQIVTRG